MSLGAIVWHYLCDAMFSHFDRVTRPVIVITEMGTYAYRGAMLKSVYCKYPLMPTDLHDAASRPVNPILYIELWTPSVIN